jgi:hypothetical protein
MQNNILDDVQMDARNAVIGCQALDLDAKKSKECSSATSTCVVAAKPMKRRILYLLIAFVTMLVGLVSRRYRLRLPSFLGEYSVDVLWALMQIDECRLRIGGACIRRSFIYLLRRSRFNRSPWFRSVKRRVRD